MILYYSLFAYSLASFLAISLVFDVFFKKYSNAISKAIIFIITIILVNINMHDLSITKIIYSFLDTPSIVFFALAFLSTFRIFYNIDVSINLFGYSIILLILLVSVAGQVGVFSSSFTYSSSVQILIIAVAIAICYLFDKVSAFFMLAGLSIAAFLPNHANLFIFVTDIGMLFLYFLQPKRPTKNVYNKTSLPPQSKSIKK